MTTRRVIILVLVMLFAMPQFLPSGHGYLDFRSSAYMGMEMVYERWRTWCPIGATDSEMPWCLQLNAVSDSIIASRAEERWWYEHYMLTFYYQHKKSDSFAWKLMWMGFNSSTLVDEFETRKGLPRTAAVDKAVLQLSELARLGQPKFLKGHALPASSWDGMFSNESWQLPVSGLSHEIRQQLSGVWEEKCNDHFIGVALSEPESLDRHDGKEPSACSINEDLRCSEVEYFAPLGLTVAEENHMRMLFAFDKRSETQLESGLSMLQTIFICLAVGLGAMSFSNDANNLLLNPIERMVGKMQAIKDNPLEAMRLGDWEFRREEIEAAKRKEQMASKGRCAKMLYAAHHHKKMKEPMETVILEKTIIKLGGLLVLGFGEAGAEIIGHNMSHSGSAGVDAMVPGNKVDAVICFCNINHFSEATEVLKEKVMLFVNQVGEIVHGCVDDYHGAPNKNIGESFLMVWRLSGVDPDKQTKMADMSILACVRIIQAINTSPVLGDYRGHPGMLQRVPNYRVQMGFGLHCGWAIEGAIGSEFKVDASYLSPNVNVASRLEGAAWAQFGTWILVTHFMVKLCSEEVHYLFREIDHVTVKGSKQPTRLFTRDLDYLALEVHHRSMEKVIRNRFKVRQVREQRKNEKWADDFQVSEIFASDEDLVAMRRIYSTEFFQRFAMAYRNYEAGEWMVARDMLYTCHYTPKSTVGGGLANAVTEDEWPPDGPTITLLNYMREEKYMAPADWPGYRALHTVK